MRKIITLIDVRLLAQKKNRIRGPINRFWPPNKRITCAHISLHSAKSQGKVKAEMKKICLLTILGLFVIADAKPQNNQGNNIQWNEERQERPPAQQNFVQWSSATYGSTSNTNWRPRPRECLNGHLHVLTGHGYGQNQR